MTVESQKPIQMDYILLKECKQIYSSASIHPATAQS